MSDTNDTQEWTATELVADARSWAGSSKASPRLLLEALADALEASEARCAELARALDAVAEAAPYLRPTIEAALAAAPTREEEPCEACHATGVGGPDGEKCVSCKGLGTIMAAEEFGEWWLEARVGVYADQPHDARPSDPAAPFGGVTLTEGLAALEHDIEVAERHARPSSGVIVTAWADHAGNLRQTLALLRGKP